MLLKCSLTDTCLWHVILQVAVMLLFKAQRTALQSRIVINAKCWRIEPSVGAAWSALRQMSDDRQWANICSPLSLDTHWFVGNKRISSERLQSTPPSRVLMDVVVFSNSSIQSSVCLTTATTGYSFPSSHWLIWGLTRCKLLLWSRPHSGNSQTAGWKEGEVGWMDDGGEARFIDSSSSQPSFTSSHRVKKINQSLNLWLLRSPHLSNDSSLARLRPDRL